MLIYEGVIVLELVLILRLDSANFDALEGVMICPELLSVNLPLILPRTALSSYLVLRDLLCRI